MVIVKADSGWTDMGTIAAYEILPTALVVHIVYMEAQPWGQILHLTTEAQGTEESEGY